MRWFYLSLLFVILVLTAVVVASWPTAAQDKPGNTQRRQGVAPVTVSGQNGVQKEPPSREITKGQAAVPSEFRGDVRDLPSDVTPEERALFAQRPELERDLPTKKPLPGARPEALTRLLGPLAPMPGPAISFDGMNFTSNGAGHPPDTVGDVGPNHFVHAVNTSIRIFDKTGATLSTFTFNSFWSGAATGTPCDTSNRGDPTVIYSPQYDRFIFADFSWTDIQNGPYYECIAVSKTSDPVAGGWWRYAVRADDAAHPWLPDYPKMGIWPDGLYMSANMFDCLDATCSTATYKDARAYAINIAKLVNGTSLTANDVQIADTTANDFTLLPSNYRGTPPPVGSPNYFAEEDGVGFFWDVFKFHVDFTTPANSTFTGPTQVSQTSYTLAAIRVPEPAPGNLTDTLADRAMMQNQYRNISGVESLWVNHTTGLAGVSTSTPTGIQWAQINVTGGTVNTTPVQQQIFNNGADGLNRFMGSLAVDKQGDMALGYTASSSTVAPDIRYVGRLSTDPLNLLPQTEVTMLPAVTRSVQFGNCGPSACTRWGDYSAMTVDPVDDCTFWYANMYVPVQGLNWVTRIGSFKFPACIPTPVPDLTITKTHVGNFTQGDAGKTYTITVTNSGSAATSGSVSVSDTVPAGLVATAVSGTNWNCTQPAGPCTRSDALGAGNNYEAITLTVNVACNAAATVTNTAQVSGGGEANTGNDTANDATTVNPGGSPPSITCPGGITRFADSGQPGATINPGTPVASSGCGSVTVTGTRSDGKPLNAQYPIGVTLITWTAKDASNQTATCGQSIAVMVPSGQRRRPEEEEALLVGVNLVIGCFAAFW